MQHGQDETVTCKICKLNAFIVIVFLAVFRDHAQYSTPTSSSLRAANCHEIISTGRRFWNSHPNQRSKIDLPVETIII